LFPSIRGEGNPEHPYGIYADHDYYNPVTDAWNSPRRYTDRSARRNRHGFHKGLIHLTGGGTAQGGSSG